MSKKDQRKEKRKKTDAIAEIDMTEDGDEQPPAEPSEDVKKMAVDFLYVVFGQVEWSNMLLGEVSRFCLDILIGSIAGFPERAAPKGANGKSFKDSFTESEKARAEREVPTFNSGMKVASNLFEVTERFRGSPLKINLMHRFALISRWYENRKTMTEHPRRVNSAQTAKEFPEGTAAQVMSAPAHFGGTRKKNKTGNAEAQVKPIATPWVIMVEGRLAPKIGDSGTTKDLLACFGCGFHDACLNNLVVGGKIVGIPLDMSKQLNVVVGVYGTADFSLEGEEGGSSTLSYKTGGGAVKSAKLEHAFLLSRLWELEVKDELPALLEQMKSKRTEMRVAKSSPVEGPSGMGTRAKMGRVDSK